MSRTPIHMYLQYGKRIMAKKNYNIIRQPRKIKVYKSGYGGTQQNVVS